MQRKTLVSAVGGVAGAAVVFGLGTYFLSGTESNTRLSEDTTVSVGGHRALAANIVAGRTQSKYHPLPWVGVKLTEVSCPSGLKAVAERDPHLYRQEERRRDRGDTGHRRQGLGQVRHLEVRPLAEDRLTS